jgi:hypothetical protein
MADYQEKPGQGVAFRKEKTTPNHPDYSGTFLTPSGEKLQIAIWEKTSAKGTPYFSIAVSEPFVKTEPAPQTSRPYQPAPKPMPEPEDEGGDLPF